MIAVLKGISKTFEAEPEPVRALKDITMELDGYEYLAIMGPSGSGKTTLMNILGCLDVPTGGSYVFGGRDVSRLDDKDMAEIRNREIGFVFQSFNLLPEYDARGNVALPLMYAGISKKERLERAEEALRRVGLGDRMGFRPYQLSGGQQQRVAIARAIVVGPKLLLADEPTGALDSATGQELMDLFDELHESGSAIVVITHERAIAERSRRILYILDGRISGGAVRRDG